MRSESVSEKKTRWAVEQGGKGLLDDNAEELCDWRTIDCALMGTFDFPEISGACGDGDIDQPGGMLITRFKDTGNLLVQVWMDTPKNKVDESASVSIDLWIEPEEQRRMVEQLRDALNDVLAKL